ncbi:MAG TPA: VWA domain-containing protein [Tepidisphaeraceae bacterium]
MNDLLLKLLGVPSEQVARITDSRLRFRGDVGFEWILLAAIALGVMVFLMYRKAAPDLSPVKKYVLATLRTVFLLLILLLLMRPVWAFVIESTVRRELVLMLDGSTSMKIEDPRSDADDLKRVAIAKGLLDPAKGLKQPFNPTSDLGKVSRLDVVRTVLRNNKFDLLPRLSKDYNVDAFTFDAALTELPAASNRREATGKAEPPPQDTDTAWVNRLSATGQQTAVGDALRAIVARKRGQPMAGIVLVTDGANNSGSDPRAAAQLAKDARVPLYIYGVGITSPKNLVVGNIFAPEISFVKDEVPVTVRVRSQGVPAAKVTLKLIDAAGQEQQVDQKDVAFDQDSEPAVALKFTPKVKGDFQLKAVVEPSDASIVELTKDDNESSQNLKVIDSKIKVLLVDQSPRWEFKYLMAQLLRDRRVDAKVVLLEGSPGLARTENSPYLDKLPDRKEDLFKYDLIILGDVDAHVFSSAQLEAIEEFVTKFGGGLAVVAGKKNNPWSYRRTPLEKMLPVELEAGGNIATGTGPGGEDVNDKPMKLELTALGKRTPMLRLAADDATSERMWAKLPPIYWVAPVARAKPAAEVFLVDPSPTRSTRYGKMPVVAAQQYGMGQVMFVGTDNTWRWRKNKGDEQYVTLWGQVIQRLALPHLLGASKRTQLTFDKKEYVTNEKVNLYARLYTESYSPITQDKVKAYITDAGPDDPRAREVILRPLPDQPGMYRGEFNAPEKAAPYKLYVELDKGTLVDLPVSEPKMEPGENALNAELLEAMAKSTGGKFVREEDLYTLPDQIRAEAPKIITNLEVEFWTSPLYYALMLLVVSAEWIMRKMVQLK